MEELWKDVPGYEQRFQVSNTGKIRSKPRIIKCGNGYLKKPGKELKLQYNNRGYLCIQFKENGINKKLYIHRAVCMAFIPNTQQKPFVNHIDCNPQNNNMNNLEWVTHTENIHHAIKNGRFNESFAKTTQKFKKSIEESQIPVIGINKDTGDILIFKSINEAGRHFNGKAGDICKCCKGERKSAQGYVWEYAI